MQQEKRLKQMGATVRNGGSYMERLKMDEERKRMTRKIMAKMPVEQLSELLSFYHAMEQICSEMLQKNIHNGLVNDLS